MVNKRFAKLSLLLWVAVGLVSIVSVVGIGEGGVTAEFQPAPIPDGWTAECIDCLRYFTAMSGSSAALDSSGRIHTAYGGDGLYYAVQQPDGSYQSEVVSQVPTRGLNAALVLDSSDRPHIIYYAGDFLRLFHAYHNGVQWVFKILSTPALNELPHPWLAIDGGDNLHLAFISGSDLLYGRYDGSDWQIETVDTDGSGNIGRPSIDIDGNNRPHIAYGRGGKYAFYDGANWQYTTFAGSYVDGESTAIRLDAGDRPHILYQTDFDAFAGLDVRYRYHDGGGWQIEDVDVAADEIGFNVGYDISLVFAGNEPAAVYSVELWSGSPYPSYNLFLPRLAIREAGGWQLENVQWDLEPIFDRNYPTILSGPGSDLTVIYKAAHELKSAVFANDAFTYDIIDTGGDSGRNLDMGVDNQDRLHVSAYEDDYLQVRYGLKSQGSWSMETVGYGPGLFASYWTSLALSSDDRPYIMYDKYDRVANMPITYFDGSVWADASYFQGDGRYYDIGMDSDDSLHLTFKQRQSDILKYLNRDTAGNWSAETVVDTGMAEARPDIVLNKYNFPHIAYPAADGLRYAVQTPSGWLTETVAAGEADYPSLALDRFGRPHIAWYEKSTADLMYAAYDGAVWQIETVDGGGDVGQYASLAVDRIGRVYIAYYDATNGDLKYAAYDDGGWSVETLVSEGDVGSYSKLAMPYPGYPAIAYYDATSRDLMLVFRPFVPDNFVYAPVTRK